MQTYLLHNDESFTSISRSKPHVVVECLWNVASPSGSQSVIVRKHTPDKNKASEDKYHFEIWCKSGHCKKVFNVSSSDKHGVVYGEDRAFGCLQWNLAEDRLLYVAEKKKKKTCTYFAELKKEMKEEDKPVAGEKFVYKEDWGEAFVDKEQPVVCVLDLTSGDVTVLEEEILANSSCGQAVWCPKENGLVFCALPHQTTKLGILHCPIRLSILYHYNFETKTLRSLTPAENISAKSPRFSPDNTKLAYLECVAGGAHCKCMRLMLIDWKSGETSVLIDLVHSPEPESAFQGIYTAALPPRCWHPDSSHIFFSTPSRSRKGIFAADVETGEVKRLTSGDACWVVQDIAAGLMLVATSAINTPPRLAIGRLEELGSDSGIQWKYLAAGNTLTNISWEVLQHKPLVPHPIYEKLTYESIILRPVNKACQGLVVLPHGGPHSVITMGYHVNFAFLVKIGFTVALVNYRGSTGFGEDSINSLLGYVGDADIKDVQQCAEEVLVKYGLDKNKVVVLGGSHGGFIAAHLIGQYPDFYKAAVGRNPVTNLATKVALSDIPDWSHIEIGYNAYIPCAVPNAELYSKLYSMSPVAHLENIKTPMMVMLGQEDRRVPPSQGIEFYKALRSRGVPARLFIYPENSHPLQTIEAESDSIINLYLWFITNLSD
ncbi:acylamino-acid-releasing enzyme-like [Watersipora subatra]|uniref:acylamino-acid-releasing enzyme-like n=1 Tax=Watersipora subatra TaxID=2589382 RepID=UPI00355B17A0